MVDGLRFTDPQLNGLAPSELGNPEAHLPWEQGVGGSDPPAPTTPRYFLFGEVSRG